MSKAYDDFEKSFIARIGNNPDWAAGNLQTFIKNCPDANIVRMIGKHFDVWNGEDIAIDQAAHPPRN